MAILKYIPPIKEIIDNRNDKGDYYEAICDVCGKKFYPKRASAKYCNSNCKQIQHRIDLAAGKITKEIKKPSNENLNPDILSIKGAKMVYKYLQEIYNTRGDRVVILENLKDLEIGEQFEYGDKIITRISTLKFEVNK